MRVEFHPEAILEFEEAVLFYKQRGSKLGRRFAQEIRAAVVKVTATPERWRIMQNDVHRCMVRVFPYSVLYTIETDHILVVAIMHGKRQPGYWQRRLKK